MAINVCFEKALFEKISKTLTIPSCDPPYHLFSEIEMLLLLFWFEHRNLLNKFSLPFIFPQPTHLHLNGKA